MKPISNFFVSPKYQKIKDAIFHGFILAVVGTGLFFFFTGIAILGIIVAVLFVVYEALNTVFNSLDVYKSAKRKRK